MLRLVQVEYDVKRTLGKTLTCHCLRRQEKESCVTYRSPHFGSRLILSAPLITCKFSAPVVYRLLIPNSRYLLGGERIPPAPRIRKSPEKNNNFIITTLPRPSDMWSPKNTKSRINTGLHSMVPL